MPQGFLRFPSDRHPKTASQQRDAEETDRGHDDSEHGHGRSLFVWGGDPDPCEVRGTRYGLVVRRGFGLVGEGGLVSVDLGDGVVGGLVP